MEAIGVLEWTGVGPGRTAGAIILVRRSRHRAKPAKKRMTVAAGQQTLRLVPISREHFPAWKRMRAALYSGLDGKFHDEETEWLHACSEAACFLAWSADDEAVGLLELTLRNVVDGCIGGPVGYIEGIYLNPAWRGRGHGARMVAFAAEWFRSRGCRHMATDAEMDNVDAQAYYRQAGFTERWRTVGFIKPLHDDSD